MSANFDSLTDKMEKLFQDIVIAEKRYFIGQLKKCFIDKKEMLNQFRTEIKRIPIGEITHKFLAELSYLETELLELHDNIDEKILIFIIGNGNVGKSTLLNALVGDEVAQTNSLPTTWKIDVYSPEVQKNQAIIKYVDGTRRTFTFKEAKRIVENEEEKTKESKRLVNKEFNKVVKSTKIKEERDEMKRFLTDKYQYISNISEVIWPVEKNWLLEQCHLVDTPGVNQFLDHSHQKNGVQDYYHKADGVLWLLDGTTIAASNSQNLYDKLQDELKAVGGIRGNIIGVINMMDLVKKNGGEQAVKQVIQDANKIYDGKFHKMIDISAYEGFVGLQSNCPIKIESSGILKLQQQIREIFLSKSEALKNQAKTQGLNKLVNYAVELVDSYINDIKLYQEMYNAKLKKVNNLSDKLFKEINKDINNFFENYLQGVNARIEIHADSLIDGKGKDFIQEQIYQLDDFIQERDIFINNKLLEINRGSKTWRKLSMISQYKYINNQEVYNLKELNLDDNLNFNSLNQLVFINTSVGDDLLTGAFNLVAKGLFFLMKNSIKQKIRTSILNQCNQMKSSIREHINQKIQEEEGICLDILNNSFSMILFDHSDTQMIQDYLDDLQRDLLEDMKETKIHQILI